MTPQAPLDERESEFAYWSRVISFGLGVVILLAELVVIQNRDYGDYILMGVGAGCLGPVVAQSIATVLASMRGGSGE